MEADRINEGSVHATIDPIACFPLGSQTADKTHDVDLGLCSSSTYSYMPSILGKSSESTATTLIKSGALSPECTV
jgi:hypothetical protein